jgi:aerobic carbon-monoxide dehydrogenase medium subunit
MLYRKLFPFDYQEAASVSEAVSILSDYGTDAAVMAGGISLIEEMKRRAVTPKVVLSIQPAGELRFLEQSNGHLRIGALATLTHGEKSVGVREEYPALWEAIAQVASVQVRNMGTIVGNIAACNPGSDVATALVALGAIAKVVSKTGERSIPIESLGIHSRKSSLLPGEIVTEIDVPRLKEGSATAFLNLARTKEDCAKVAVAVNARVKNGVIEEVKIALGAVAPVIVRAPKAEKMLTGEKPSERLIRAAAAAIPEENMVTPISDIRSTAQYRKQMVEVLTRRVLTRVFKNYLN